MTYKVDYAWLDEEILEIDLLGAGNPERTCEACGVKSKRVVDCPSYTQYHWDGKGEDPNRDLQLCLECAEGYMEQMESQWADYYGGLL
jgi:hypothetical protein